MTFIVWISGPQKKIPKDSSSPKAFFIKSIQIIFLPVSP